MNETVSSAPCRTIERRHCSTARCSIRAGAPINYRLAVSFLTMTLRRELLVEFRIEQYNLTLHSGFRKRLELIEIVDGDNRRDQPRRWSSDAAAERGQYELLCRSRYNPGILG